MYLDTLYNGIKMAIVPRIRGSKRKKYLTQHRQSVFEIVFDKYIEGKVSARHVASRGRKFVNITKARHSAARAKKKRYKST